MFLIKLIRYYTTKYYFKRHKFHINVSFIYGNQNLS
jgi:hypothetical protein